MEEYQQQRRKDELQKTEEQTEKSHGKGQEEKSRAYLTRPWNFKEQDVMI